MVALPRGIMQGRISILVERSDPGKLIDVLQRLQTTHGDGGLHVNLRTLEDTTAEVLRQERGRHVGRWFRGRTRRARRIWRRGFVTGHGHDPPWRIWYRMSWAQQRRRQYSTGRVILNWTLSVSPSSKISFTYFLRMGIHTVWKLEILGFVVYQRRAIWNRVGKLYQLSTKTRN